MLTGDLVRGFVRGGFVRVKWIDPTDPGLQAEAERLIALFRRHVGDTDGALEEAIADHIGDSTDFMLQRGLAKLLRDRSTFEMRAARPPEEIRRAVFEAAAATGTWPVRPEGGAGFAAREEVVARAAEVLGITREEVEDGLFADLSSEARLTAFDKLDARALLERYNLALAQAVLLKAREVRVEITSVSPKRARQLFRAIKFRGLMHRATPTKKGYSLVLDGPLSLLRQTNRYGLQMAMFLPGLALCERWTLEADVVWGKNRTPCRFKLSDEQGLVSPARDTGTWVSEEERHLEASWAAVDTPWRLEREARIIDLDGRGVLTPDYVLRHEDGREALLDIVWFWRKQSFARRLSLLKEAGPPNLIVALATRLNADRGDTDVGEASVYPFKGVIVPKRLIALAEEVAVVPTAPAKPKAKRRRRSDAASQ
ncbi:MAG: DUF790 family protein [Deltaproteobacteria bacterium]|nr:MAG: DUF790 family protein [Deltaproteobacteria bacterium]